MVLTIVSGLIISFLVIILDQFSKASMLALLSNDPDQTIGVIGNFFKLKLCFNNGAAFSSFSGNFGFLMAMTVLGLILFCFMAKWCNFKKAPWYSVGVYFMIGGMFGNFIDRVFMPNHEVVDFLSFTFFDKYEFATFNVADSFLVVGVILVVIDILFFESKRKGKNDD